MSASPRDAPGSGWVLGLHRCRKCSSPNRLRMEGLFLRLEARRCWRLNTGFNSPVPPIRALRWEQEGSWGGSSSQC